MNDEIRGLQAQLASAERAARQASIALDTATSQQKNAKATFDHAEARLKDATDALVAGVLEARKRIDTTPGEP